MKRTVSILIVITMIASMLLAGCSGNDRPKKLDLEELQSDARVFQFYGLEWESNPDMAQRILDITFGQPDSAGGSQIYRMQNAYTWKNVTASLACEYEAEKLYAVRLMFQPDETKREEFWSELKEELFNLYGTVEGDTQTSASDKVNISTERESYLWQDQDSGNTLMAISKFSTNGKFKYISLDVYMMK